MSSVSVKKFRGIHILSNKDEQVKTLLKKGDSPEIHGDKVWFSSYFIMNYLTENPIEKKSRVTEIGCGWGALSVFCAKKFKAKATGVDADKNVMPFVNLHAKKNAVRVNKKICRYEDLDEKYLEKQDLIVGGDICFWNELVDPLFSLIKKSVKQKGEKNIIIADPGRSPFLELAKRCRKKFGAELVPVSIEKPIKETGYLLIIKA